MPELPEVETVKETLKRKLLNKKIKDIKIIYPNIIATDINEFKKNIINKMIKDILRRGKYLVFVLNDYYLLVHLRMEGKFFIRDTKDEIMKHEHIIFYFDDFTLRYHDTRKFGKMYLIKLDDLYKVHPLCDIGIEPFNEKLDSSYLKKHLNKNISIKTLLLDQTIISGIGNIYADEILFYSKINPLTKGCNLNNDDYIKIIDNTRKILLEAIKLGGTTIRSYTSSLGVTGRFQNNLMVHNRLNEPCYICKSNIIKIKVNERGTYYCPICQKER